MRNLLITLKLRLAALSRKTKVLFLVILLVSFAVAVGMFVAFFHPGSKSQRNTELDTETEQTVTVTARTVTGAEVKEKISRLAEDRMYAIYVTTTDLLQNMKLTTNEYVKYIVNEDHILQELTSVSGTAYSFVTVAYGDVTEGDCLFLTGSDTILSPDFMTSDRMGTTNNFHNGDVVTYISRKKYHPYDESEGQIIYDTDLFIEYTVSDAAGNDTGRLYVPDLTHDAIPGNSDS